MGARAHFRSFAQLSSPRSCECATSPSALLFAHTWIVLLSPGRPGDTMPPKKKAKVAASDASAGSAVATNAGALSMTGADHAGGSQPKKSRSRTARAVAATTRVTRSRSTAVAAGNETAAPKVHYTASPKVKATPAQKRVARLTAPLEDLPLDVLIEVCVSSMRQFVGVVLTCPRPRPPP